MIIKYKDAIGDAWTILSETVIMNISPITGSALDSIPFLTVVLIDNEGGLFASWNDKQGRFICVKNNDDDEYFFIGKVDDINFSNKRTILDLVGGLDELTDDEAYERNYILSQGIISVVDSQTKLTVTDSEGNSLGWVVNQWSTQRDVAVILTDATAANTKEWFEDDEDPTHSGWDFTNLNGAKCLVPNNGFYDEGRMTAYDANPYNNYFDYEPKGDLIPNTEEIESINIKYRVGGASEYLSIRGSFIFEVWIWNYDSSVWEELIIWAGGANVHGIASQDWSNIIWSSDEEVNVGVTITTNPAYYLHDTGANFDYVKIRVKAGDGGTGKHNLTRCYVDYIKVTVNYQTAAFSPYMIKITSNGVSDITCIGATFQDKGISIDDKFQIGENTTRIIEDSLPGLNITRDIDSNLDKYMARHFKGVTRRSVIDAVNKLEGSYLSESDTADLPSANVYRSANFLNPSGGQKGHIDTPITEADYDIWKLGRPNNAYDGVKVYGNSYNGIEATAGATSGKIKKIIDDSIKTKPNAQDVANAQYAIFGTLRPSYQITLSGDSYDHLRAGMNVYVTFARPTIVKTEYPIRSIMRSQGANGKTGIMNTTVELGLGATTAEEKLAEYINKALEISSKTASNFLLPGSSSGLPTISHTYIDNVTAIQHHTKYTNAEALAYVNAIGLALANTKVITSQDADLTFTFGRTQIDSRFSDMMTISHRDMSTQDEYAFGQISSGSTYINAPTGQLIHLHINDIMKMSLSAGSLSMGVPIAMGANKITGLANGTVATNAMAFGQIGDILLSNLSDITANLALAIKSMDDTGIDAYPASPKEGQIYYDRDEEMMLRWNNTAGAWIEFGGGAGLIGGNSMYLLLGGGTMTGPVNMANKNITSIDYITFWDGGSANKILDEDNMASDDPVALATQQSIKAYVDAANMIGEANAVWIPIIYMLPVETFEDTPIIHDNGVLLTTRPAIFGITEWLFQLPLPTNQGGLKLHIKGVRIELGSNVNINNYVSRALVRAGDYDHGNLIVVTDQNPPNPAWNSPGSKIETFGAVDVSGVMTVTVRLFIAVSLLAGEVDVEGLFLHCYYDT